MQKKKSFRQEKMADEIRKSVASYLIHGHKNPEVGFVTVTRVKVTPDLHVARVYFTAYGENQDIEKSTRALQSSAKEIRHHLARDLNARYTPNLEFFFDEELEKINRMEKIFYDLGQNGGEKK